MFYFAWVDSTETTFTAAHKREDEQILSIKIDHAEGDFPSCDIEIKNPRIGLLAPARKISVRGSSIAPSGRRLTTLFSVMA